MKHWQPGDIAYHKATEEKVVINGTGFGNKGELVRVTRPSGEKEVYHPNELWTEEEYRQSNSPEEVKK